MNVFEYFVNYLYGPFILFGGILGNLLSLLILASKKLDKIGPGFIYKSLIIVDTLVIMQILQTYLATALNKDFSSIILCSLYWFVVNVTSSTSPFLLCYISIEKVVSIVYSVKKLKERSIQIISFVAILTYNILVQVKVLFSLQIFHSDNSLNETNGDFCGFMDLNAQLTISYINLFNRVLFPFPVLTLTSVWLIYKIIFSRKKALGKNGSDKGFLRRLRLSTTTITFNIVYLFLSLPETLTYLMPEYNSNKNMPFYLAATYTAFLSYAINFIVLSVSNRLFRQQIFNFFRISSYQE